MAVKTSVFVNKLIFICRKAAWPLVWSEGPGLVLVLVEELVLVQVLVEELVLIQVLV